jgi:hypothetical protein
MASSTSLLNNNATGAGDMNDKISSVDFYRTYSGHKVPFLKKLRPRLRESSDSLIWTAGDSSLDNKYWFPDTGPAVGAYKDTLEPPTSKCDVVYWLNVLLEEQNSEHATTTDATQQTQTMGRIKQKMAAINTAVEATTLNQRTCKLLPQDVFLRDNIRPEDTLIVSVGGNDVALAPCPCTIAAIGGLLCLPQICMERGFSYGTVPVDDCCCGCGPSLCSCACACPPCLGYFRHMFGTRIEKYIEALTAKTKPSKILVCWIYFPDEANTPGWAGPALGALGYNRNPAKLQQLIRMVFEEAISKINIPGSTVIPVPLYHVLDGRNTQDYVARVEPSPSGGRKMAEFLLHKMNETPVGAVDSHSAAGLMMASAPAASAMRDR